MTARTGLLPFWKNYDRKLYLKAAILADELGYDSFWIPEAWGYEIFSLLTEVAVHTKQIKIGTGIVNCFSRSPGLLAMNAATVDEISEGRLILGLGTSGKRVIEGFHAREFNKPLTQLRDVIRVTKTLLSGKRLDEMIEVVRKLWSGEPVSHDDGSFFKFPEVILSPAPKAPIPIWSGGASKPAFRRAANRCQGWLGLWYTPDRAVLAVRDLLDQRKASARADEPFEVLIGLMGLPNEETLAQLEAAGVTGIIGTPWQMENPAMAPFAAKQAAIEKYSKHWIKPKH